MDGGSFAGTLFVVFLVLKLVGVIAWSWWWVTSPLWIDAGFSLLVFGVLALFGINVFKFIRNTFREVRNEGFDF